MRHEHVPMRTSPSVGGAPASRLKVPSSARVAGIWHIHVPRRERVAEPQSSRSTGACVVARRSIRSAARSVPRSACIRAAIPAIRSRSAASASSASIAPVSSSSAKRVGRQPPPEARLVDALGVVDLVPEQRQHDHRLAVVERLDDGVVAAVRDHEVDQRQDRRLGQERLAGHVVVEPDLVGQRSLGHDHPVLRAPEHVDQALHQLDVGRPEAAERQVDQGAGTRRQVLGQRPRRRRSPGSSSRAGATSGRAASSAGSRPRRDRRTGSGTAIRA